MSSIRLRLLVSLLALLALVAAADGGVTYRNVLGETEAIFDYQLQQMALSLRDQGEIASAQVGRTGRRAARFRDPDLDRRRPQHLRLARRTRRCRRARCSAWPTLKVDGRAWRTFSVATRERVIQVAQPVEIRQRLAAHAAWRSVLPLLLMAPLAALAIWWLAAQQPRAARSPGRRGARARRPLARAAARRPACPTRWRRSRSALNALLERLRELARQRSARSSPTPRTSCARR